MLDLDNMGIVDLFKLVDKYMQERESKCGKYELDVDIMYKDWIKEGNKIDPVNVVKPPQLESEEYNILGHRKAIILNNIVLYTKSNNDMLDRVYKELDVDDLMVAVLPDTDELKGGEVYCLEYMSASGYEPFDVEYLSKVEFSEISYSEFCRVEEVKEDNKNKIDKYNNDLKAVASEHHNSIYAFAGKYSLGYVSTILNRLRYIKKLHSKCNSLEVNLLKALLHCEALDFKGLLVKFKNMTFDEYNEVVNEFLDTVGVDYARQA